MHTQPGSRISLLIGLFISLLIGLFGHNLYSGWPLQLVPLSPIHINIQEYFCVYEIHT